MALGVWIVLIQNCFADEGGNEIEKIARRMFAEGFSVKDGELHFKTKKLGNRFLFMKNDEPPVVLEYSESRVLKLNGGRYSFAERHFSINIFPEKDSGGVYVFEESTDLRSFGGELKSRIFRFKVKDDKIMVISQKVESENEIKKRQKREERLKKEKVPKETR